MKIYFIIAFTILGTIQSMAEETNKIIIRGDSSFPPYEFINDKGEPDGFNVDLIGAIMEEMKQPYELKLEDWSNVLYQFENREVDLITGMARTEKLKNEFSLSKAHSYVNYSFVCRKGEFIRDDKELAEKNIILQRGALPYKRLKSMDYGDHLIVVDNMVEGLEILAGGVGDVALCPDNMAKYLIEKDGLTNLVVMDSGWPLREYCFVAADSGLLEQVNAAILKLKKNGVYDRIYTKWLGEKPGFNIPLWIYFLLGALLLTALLLSIFVTIYKRRIRRGEMLFKKEVAEQEARLELAMMAGNVAAWFYDPHTQVFSTLRGNALAGQGLSMEENMNTLHPGDRGMQKELLEAMSRGEKETAETVFRYWHEDGTYHYYESRMTAKKEDGEVVAILGTQKDITSEVMKNKILNNTVEKLQFAIQTAGIAMWEYDCKSHLFTSYNDPIADYKDATPISMSTYDSYFQKDGTDWERLENATRIMKNGEDKSYSFEVKMKTKYDSDWQYCIVRAVPLEKDGKGKVVKYLGVRLNITEQIKYQKVLVEKKEKAEQADKLKSAFLANMSHEIRTPLNAIVGFSELLQTTDEPEEKEEFISIIHNNNELLLRLIGDILDLSKIESGLIELKTEEFDLSEAFRKTYTALKQRCTNPEVEFLKCNPYKSCKVELDQNRVVQVGTNFITNALKHTTKGHILIGYEYTDGGIRIYVEDTGSGISKEKQSKLFQRFAKLDDFTQGTGLGLAICKAIVDATGGKIGAVSEEGKGSTFWAWFPCDAKIEEYEEVEMIDESTTETVLYLTGKQPQDLASEKVYAKSILVAEDIDSNFMLAKAILKTCKLTRAITGREAVELAAARHFDAILMDMKMPVMDGIEATLKIREFDQTIPIIAVTANAFDSDKEKAIKAGCNAFVTKPLKKKELEDILRSRILG